MTTLRDEPALDDETTAKLFDYFVQCLRGAWFGLFIAPLFAVFCLWVLWDLPNYWPFAVGAISVYVWGVIADFVPGRPGWVRPARRLLAEQPWRPSPATVLDVRGTVLALPDGTHVRVDGLPVAAREVVVRAGKVALVGPDSAGWLAVRVDGMHTPWPARVVRSRDAEPATPSATPVTTMWVDRRVGRRTADLAALAAGTVVLAVLALVVGREGWVLPGVLAFGAIGAVWLWQRLRAARRLRHRGPWEKAFAIMLDWESRPYGTGDGRIELRFPDGRRCVAELSGVPLDVLANAWREEALWVTDGNVVGFPDYPVVATARFSVPEEVSGP